MAKSQQKLSDGDLQKLIQLVRKTQLDYKLEQFENSALKQINKSVARARNDISRKLKTIKPTSTFSVDRMNALANEMQDLTVAIQSQITKEITKTTVAAGSIAYAEQNDILSFGGMVPNFNPVSLSAPQLNAIVKTPVGGKKLNEWVEKSFSSRLQDQFKSQITTGMLLGESYHTMIKRFDGGVYEGFRSDIEGLTRTYVQSINVKAAQDVAKANSDIVKGWKWSSVAENRTCIRCISLSAADILYEIGGGPDMPLHISCRCFPHIITKTFREMGIDVDEIKKTYSPYTIRGTIDPVTGAINPSKIGVGGGRIISTGRFLGTFEDYFNGVSKAVKIQMLGPTRYGLWKSGKLKLADMADKNGNTILLKDMGVKKGKIPPTTPKTPLPVFVPAETLEDVLVQLPKHLEKFSGDGILLEGITKAQRASILAGMNDSVVRYGGKLRSIGWQIKKRRSLGVAVESGDYIRFQKTGVKNVNKIAKKDHEAYQARRLDAIEKRKKDIKDFKRTSIVEYNKKKLKELKLAKRWAAFYEAEDPLRAVAAHEGFHNVYFTRNLEKKFELALKQNKVGSWFEVGEYAASNIEELFAEIGTAITSGVSIPKPFIKAFHETMKGIKL